MDSNTTTYEAMMKKQWENVALAKETCNRLNTTYYAETATNKLQCPPFFDTIMCWPATPTDTIATQTCPNYVIGFTQMTENATRHCLENGTWHDYTDYFHCSTGETIRLPTDINKTHALDNLKSFVPTINIISRTGYSISFFTLILAFLIMFSIKKLHCARNRLHMHLFASFIMRAGMRLLKDLLFTDGIGLNYTTMLGDDKYIVVDERTSNWACKLFTSLFNFFITANYSWILMEGLYLYNLIFRSMFADSNMKITQYIVLGWGMPFIVVGAWTIARILMEDTYCWTTHDQDKMTFWIIRIPTAISIMLNLYLFVRIALVIYMKLQSPNQEETRSYRKWARSTLVLAPLFGIHYALLIGMTSSSNETVEIIWLFADQLFASFNGFVVAILYCFLNSEVRAELKPHVHAILIYIATHNCLKYLFPCRERYLRSARGRTSVCTTMSCSSLFNNTVNHHRSSRSGLRGDQALRAKNDRNKEHVCHPNARYFQDDYQARHSRGSSLQFLANGHMQNTRLGSLGEEISSEAFCMIPDNQQQQQHKLEIPD